MSHSAWILQQNEFVTWCKRSSLQTYNGDKKRKAGDGRQNTGDRRWDKGAGIKAMGDARRGIRDGDMRWDHRRQETGETGDGIKELG